MLPRLPQFIYDTEEVRNPNRTTEIHYYQYKGAIYISQYMLNNFTYS